MVGRRRVIIDGEEFVEVRPSKGRRTGEATFIFRLPLQEAQQAARLSKSALIVWMELQHQCHRKQVQLVTLPVAELAEWGIDRQSRYNAAKQLVAAGLIHTVPKAPGQATLYGLGPAPKPRKQRASGREKKRSGDRRLSLGHGIRGVVVAFARCACRAPATSGRPAHRWRRRSACGRTPTGCRRCRAVAKSCP